MKTTLTQCQERLRDERVETAPSRIAPNGLISSKRFNTATSPSFKEGWYEVQDEGSQIACFLAQPDTNSFVLDACAGAGGKSLALADLMGNTGEILALDIDRRRLSELEKRARRNGVTTIVTARSDDVHPGDLLGKADLVLVDAPCSGVGTIRRNPGFKWSLSLHELDPLTEQQRRLLDSNASFVKKGGKLVYITCSLLRKENEKIVNDFLNHHEEFQAVLPRQGLDQLKLESAIDERYVKLLPHRHGTDGFFVAVLERNNYIGKREHQKTKK